MIDLQKIDDICLKSYFYSTDLEFSWIAENSRYVDFFYIKIIKRQVFHTSITASIILLLE